MILSKIAIVRDESFGQINQGPWEFIQFTIDLSGNCASQFRVQLFSTTPQKYKQKKTKTYKRPHIQKSANCWFCIETAWFRTHLGFYYILMSCSLWKTLRLLLLFFSRSLRIFCQFIVYALSGLLFTCNITFSPPPEGTMYERLVYANMIFLLLFKIKNEFVLRLCCLSFFSVIRLSMFRFLFPSLRITWFRLHACMCMCSNILLVSFQSSL